MPTVWIPQQNDKNTEPARKWGDIEVIVLHDWLNYEKNFDLIERTLNGSMKEDDLILMVGNPAYQALCAHTAICLFGEANMLLWDAKTLSYRKIQM